jgi:hypothetical protein
MHAPRHASLTRNAAFRADSSGSQDKRTSQHIHQIRITGRSLRRSLRTTYPDHTEQRNE